MIVSKPNKLKHWGHRLFDTSEHAAGLSIAACEFWRLETVSTIVAAAMIVSVLVLVAGYTMDLILWLLEGLAAIS